MSQLSNADAPDVPDPAHRWRGNTSPVNAAVQAVPRLIPEQIDGSPDAHRKAEPDRRTEDD